MSLKVIGAGFGRTGTTSLQAALEQLGFDRCYHMSETIKNPSHGVYWIDALNGKKVDWQELFRGYQATVDWPGCTYYKELMDAFPDAKVLLSVRDPKRWYESSYQSIYQIPGSLLVRLINIAVPHLRTMNSVVVEGIWGRTFANRFEDKAYAIEVYNRHIEEVKTYVPAERLLVYNVKEGWEPLCQFLHVDVPVDTPFPHLNDRVLMQRAMRWGPVLILAIMGALVVLLVWFVVAVIGPLLYVR